MQKIEECDSTCYEETLESSSIVKKNVHFESQQSINKQAANDLNNETLDFIQTETESGTPPKNNTTNHRNAKVKLRQKSNSKYLVCFKASRKERSSDIFEHNVPGLSENSITTSNSIKSFDDEQKIKNPSKSKVNIHLNRTIAEPLLSSPNNSYELNKVSNHQRYGFRTQVLRIFRQFNLKNQSCCK